MPTILESFHRPKAVTHALLAGEITSGIAEVLVFNSPDSTEDFLFMSKIANSGVVKTDFKANYNAASGTVIIENGSSSFALGDVVTIIGMKYV